MILWRHKDALVYTYLTNAVCKFFVPPAAARGREQVGTPHTPPGAEPLDPVEKNLHLGLTNEKSLSAFLVSSFLHQESREAFFSFPLVRLLGPFPNYQHLMIAQHDIIYCNASNS